MLYKSLLVKVIAADNFPDSLKEDILLVYPIGSPTVLEERMLVLQFRSWLYHLVTV